RRTRACTGGAGPCGCGTGRRPSRPPCRRGSSPAPLRSAPATAATCRSRSGRRPHGSPRRKSRTIRRATTERARRRRSRATEQELLPVDLHAREALADDLVEEILVLALAAADEGRIDREARSLRQAQHLIDDRVDRLPGDRLAAYRAMRPADARIQEAQVVVD